MSDTKINLAEVTKIGVDAMIASHRADALARETYDGMCATVARVIGEGTTVNRIATAAKAAVAADPTVKGIATSATTVGYHYRVGLWLALPVGECDVTARAFAAEYVHNRPQPMILAVLGTATDRADAISKITEGIRVAGEAAARKSADARATGAADRKADDAPQDGPQDGPQDDAPQDDAPQDDAPQDAPQDDASGAPRAAALAAVERWLTTADAWNADDLTVAAAIVAALAVATERASVTA